MKKFAIVLILIMVCAIPASARTCRNGRMTIYHNDNYGYYQNNHVNTGNLYGNNHVYNKGNNAKPKPVYSHRPLSSGNSFSSRPVAGKV